MKLSIGQQPSLAGLLRRPQSGRPAGEWLGGTNAPAPRPQGFISSARFSASSHAVFPAAVLSLRLLVCFTLAAGSLILSGCSKAPKPMAADPAVPAVAAGQPPAAVVPVPVHEPVPVPVGGNQPSPQTIHEMEKVLVGYMISQHHRPQSFEEFVAATKIQVPPPPPGKKYVIAQNMHIILVSK